MVLELEAGHKEVNRMYGQLLLDTGQFSQCIAVYTRYLANEPGDAHAYFNRGLASTHEQRWSDALRDFTQAIHLDPNNAELFYQRGVLLTKAQPMRAVRDFSVSLLLDSSPSRSKVYLQRGLAYVHLGQYNQAIPDFQMALKLEEVRRENAREVSRAPHSVVYPRITMAHSLPHAVVHTHAHIHTHTV
jgi:tetratricopeptide (TPR) repeat protein